MYLISWSLIDGKTSSIFRNILLRVVVTITTKKLEINEYFDIIWDRINNISFFNDDNSEYLN